MLQVLIDSGSGYVDYSKYVIDDTISVTQTINQPSVIDLRFCNFDDQFVIPTRSSFIKLYSTDNSIVLATGFITQEPEIAFFNQVRAKNLLSYHIVATSDEWILNKKPIPFIPAFVNQTMGSILRTLAETLVPGFFTYQIDEGDIVPYFAYDPKKSWTEIAKSFYDSIRYHYYALDKVLYFKPLGDLNLGLKYDDSPTRNTTRYFSPELLKTQLQPITVVNDAIVIGDVEPRNYVEENFIGDGFTSSSSLKTKVFRGASALLLQEDWTGTAFNKNLWTTLDTTGKFSLAGSLNLLAGSGVSVLGTAYIVGNNGLELGGHLNIQAGQVEFNDIASRGILGGIYNSSDLILPNCNVGFMVSGGNIRPIINGVPQTPLVSIVASTPSLSKQYVLQTLISSNQWSRYNRVFSTLAGVPYGGTDVDALADVTYVIQEVSLPVPTELEPAPRATTVTYRVLATGVTLPSFGVFAPVNSVDLQATVASTLISQPPQAKLTAQSLYGASGSNLPVSPSGLSLEQNYMIGFGMAGQIATIQSTSDVQLLSFYDDTVPSAGARIKLRYWQAGAAIGRVRDQALITAEAKIPGDDGIRTAIVSDLNPLPRTSVECELAGAAYIADRSQTQFNGNYEVQNNFWKLNAPGVTGNTDYPRPGRFFNIHSPMRNIQNRDFLVQSIKTTVDLQKIEQMVFSINFGPDLYINKLLPSFVKNIGGSILTPEDTGVDPTPQEIEDIGTTYIGDLPDVTTTAITGTSASFDLGAVLGTGGSGGGGGFGGGGIGGGIIGGGIIGGGPMSGGSGSAEVRLIDGGWGVDDGNRLLYPAPQTFTLARTAIDQTYYIRQIDGVKTSRYTTQIRIVYPLIPAAPSLVSFSASGAVNPLNPQLVLGLSGDIRNVCGVEVRAQDNTTILFQRRFTSIADLNFSLDNSIAKSRNITVYCYFFNLLWEYSAARVANVLIPAPVAPAIGSIDVNGTIVNVNLSTDDNTYLTQTEIQSADDSGFTTNQKIALGIGAAIAVLLFHSSIFAFITKYFRVRRHDPLGPGPWSGTTSQSIVLSPPEQTVIGTLNPDTRPAGLTIFDANRVFFYATDYDHKYRWTGTTWSIMENTVGGPYWKDVPPSTAGWVLCDGSSQNVSNPDGTYSSHTIPDAITGNPYIRGGAVYSGPSAQAAIAPTISGSTGTETGHTHGFTPAGTVTGNMPAHVHNLLDDLVDGGNLIFSNAVFLDGTPWTIAGDLSGTTQTTNVDHDHYIDTITGTASADGPSFTACITIPEVEASQSSHTHPVGVNGYTELVFSGTVNHDHGVGSLTFTDTSEDHFHLVTGSTELSGTPALSLTFFGSGGTTGGGSSHSHTGSSLTVSTTGQPLHMTLLPYYRL